MTINELRSFPSVVSGTHESCYRSYQLLERVKEMLKRGDSKETIMEIINEVEYSEEKIKVKYNQE